MWSCRVADIFLKRLGDPITTRPVAAACRRKRLSCYLASPAGVIDSGPQQLTSGGRFLGGQPLDFGCSVDPGSWGVASPPRLNVDFVVNSTLLVKPLQIRQQGRPRELHRFWCWPQRSSHGRDQHGFRPCTLTPGPAPKTTATLILYRSVLLLFFLRKSHGEVLEKIDFSLVHLKF